MEVDVTQSSVIDEELHLKHLELEDRFMMLPNYDDDIKIIKCNYTNYIDDRYDLRPLVYLASKYEYDIYVYPGELGPNDIEEYLVETLESVCNDPQFLLHYAVKRRCVNMATSDAKDMEKNDRFLTNSISLEEQLHEYINEEKSWDPNSDLEKKYKKLLRIIENLYHV